MRPNLKLDSSLSPELKAFAIPLISIVIVGLIFMFAILPLWNQVVTKNQQLNTSKQLLAQLTQKEQALENEDTTGLREQFNRAEIALPSGKEVPALLVGISRLYREQGLELSNFKITPGSVSTPSATPDGSGQAGTQNATPVVSQPVGIGNQIFPSNKRLDFDIVLTGTLEQARGFLQQLEKSLRLMVVNSFTFSQGNDGSAQIVVKISAPFEPFPPIPKEFAEALPTLSSADKDYLKKLESYTPVTVRLNAVTSTPTIDRDPFGGGTSTPSFNSDDFEIEEEEEATGSGDLN